MPTEDAFRLLRALGPRVLVSLDPDQKGAPRYYGWAGGDEAEATGWIRAENATRNVYVHVNAFEVGEGGPRRARKEDVRGARWLHVDLDARQGEDLEAELARIRGRLLAHDPPPTFAVMSGGGYNAWWELTEEVGDPEPYCRGLAAALGGDACWNKDRILRLPGTVNWPNERKRKKGRAPREAVVDPATGGRYPPTAFPRVEAGGAGGGAGGGEAAGPVGDRVADMDDPRLKNVPAWAKALIVQGDSADKPFSSRSEALFAACCAMARGGVDEGTMLAVVTDPGLGISSSVLDKGAGADRYARRQVGRAVEAVGAEAEFHRAAKEPHPILKDSFHNVRVALRGLGVEVAYDEFRYREVARGVPGMPDGDLTEDGKVRLLRTVQERYGFTPGMEFWFTAVRDLCRERGEHPVREYLAEVEGSWDGVGRLDRWLVDWCGAEDTAYARAVGAIALVALVRRVRDPGCKHDAMLVLEGEQGVGKSTLLERLAVRPGWFADKADLGGDPRALMEAIEGKWVVEAAEMRGVRGRDAESVKAALSRRVDRARMSYRREAEDRPRQCVFFGTVNPGGGGYLSDDTGNRRFWPVRVGEIDLLAFSKTGLVDMLWAEACARETAGMSLELPVELRPSASVEQEDRRQAHPWEGALAELGDWGPGWVRPSSVLDALGVPVGQRSINHSTALARVMRQLGWEPDALRRGLERGTRIRIWRRGPPDEPLREVELIRLDQDSACSRIMVRYRDDPGELQPGGRAAT